MNTRKIPKKIYPDNILHTIAQIRFGSVYKDVQSDYLEHRKLDITNIPAGILKNDVALLFAPLHVFKHYNIESTKNVFKQAYKHYKKLFFKKLIIQDYIHSLKREY